MRLRVLSYNLLAPLFVRVEGQPYSMFAHAPAAALDWSNRQPLVLRALERAEADVICLQEVEYAPDPEGPKPFAPPPWLLRFGEAAGYLVLPEPLSAGDWRRRADRNLRKAGKQACAGLVSLVRRGLEPARARGAPRGLLVRCGPPEAPLTVANVHLEGHPDKGAERAKQLRGVLTRARKGPPSHVVVAGDWNTSAAPDTPVGALVADLAGMRRVPLGATWCGAPAGPRAVDQILYDDTLSLEAARVDLDDEDLAQGMPNARSPSDHAPVQVDLQVRGAPRSVEVIEPRAPAPPPPPELPAEVRAELAAAWRALLAEGPPQPRGTPDAEERAALRAFKARKKAFVDGLPSDAHRAFVKGLPSSAASEP